MSAFTDLAARLQKPKPRALDKEARDKLVVTTDTAESLKARKRADGRCEIFVVGEGRCTRKDMHTHHMLSGWGRRARGRSALSEHKQRSCDRHHSMITNHTLKLLVDGDLPMFSDAYEQVR